MKHTHLRQWNVCDGYVKRMCSVSKHMCEPYVIHMRNTCETITSSFLRLVCVVLMFRLRFFLRIYVAFYVGVKIRPDFAQITWNKVIFGNAQRSTQTEPLIMSMIIIIMRFFILLTILILIMIYHDYVFCLWVRCDFNHVLWLPRQRFAHGSSSMRATWDVDWPQCLVWRF